MNREERREIAQGTLDKYLGLEDEERCAMIMHLNMCGVERKAPLLEAILRMHKVGVLGICETHLEKGRKHRKYMDISG